MKRFAFLLVVGAFFYQTYSIANDFNKKKEFFRLARCGKLKQFRIFWQKNSNILDKKDIERAFSKAVDKTKEKIVAFLLDNCTYFEKNFINEVFFTTLEDESWQITKLFLQKRMDQLSTENIEQALKYAARGGSTDIIKEILQKKKDVSQETLAYICMAAVRSNNVDIINCLLVQGGDIPFFFAMALSFANYVKNMEMINFLVQKGSMLNKTEANDGLNWAIEKESWQVIEKFLLERRDIESSVVQALKKKSENSKNIPHSIRKLIDEYLVVYPILMGQETVESYCKDQKKDKQILLNWLLKFDKSLLIEEMFEHKTFITYRNKCKNFEKSILNLAVKENAVKSIPILLTYIYKFLGQSGFFDWLDEVKEKKELVKVLKNWYGGLLGFNVASLPLIKKKIKLVLNKNKSKILTQKKNCLFPENIKAKNKQERCQKKNKNDKKVKTIFPEEIVFKILQFSSPMKKKTQKKS